MKIDEIKTKIENSKFKKNNDLTGLVKLVLNLYHKNRIDNTNLEEDGDMLIFQWGTYDWSDGKYFEIDVTRQVIPDLEDVDEATDNMQQLKTSFKYPSNEATSMLQSGNKWCALPSELKDFESFIEDNIAFVWGVQNITLKIDVELSYI